MAYNVTINSKNHFKNHFVNNKNFPLKLSINYFYNLILKLVLIYLNYLIKSKKIKLSTKIKKLSTKINFSTKLKNKKKISSQIKNIKSLMLGEVLCNLIG